MLKLSDLNESERQRAKVDKNGEVLCLWCEKNPAKVSEYGMIRKCDECEKKETRYGFAIINEFGKNKHY